MTDWFEQNVERDAELAEELIEERGADEAEQLIEERGADEAEQLFEELAAGEELEDRRRGDQIDPEHGEDSHRGASGER